jgi:transcriptional regulator with XRE-family HTH domain
MLPPRKAPSFPEALAAARTKLGWNNSELAAAARISPTVVGRYQNRDNAQFLSPSQRTWEQLDKTISAGLAELGGSGSLSLDDGNGGEKPRRIFLDEANTNQLIAALKQLGATNITMTFP